MRNKLPAMLAAVVAVGGMTACGSDDNSANGGGGKEPLRIALTPPSSGALAVFGADAVEAWKFAAEEVNAQGGVDGRKVSVTTYESNGTPAGTLQAARKAATQGQIRFISGVVSSVEAAAVAKQATALNALVLVGMAKDDSLTGQNCSPNLFHTAVSTGMDNQAIAAVLARLPAKRWAIQATDYLQGHTAAELFKEAVEKAGKQVVLTQFAPPNTTEYGSYITKLKQSGADGLFAQEVGADAIAFINQGAQFKLFDQFNTVMGSNLVSEPLFKTLGSKIVGFYNNLNYASSVDTSYNQKFVEAWKAKHGEEPYYIHADNYLTAQLLFEAVRKAASIDPAKVREAMNSLSIKDSIIGSVRVRPEDHQLLRDTYVGQIVKKAGGPAGLGWKVVETVPPDQTTPQPNPACKL